MSWWPPKAAMCKALHPSLLASRISAPNFTSKLNAGLLMESTSLTLLLLTSYTHSFLLFISADLSSSVSETKL